MECCRKLSAKASAKVPQDLRKKAWFLSQVEWKVAEVLAEKHAESDGEAYKVPPLPQRVLPGGYTVGDRAVTLISREAYNQTLLMELGQEGNIVGAARGQGTRPPP
ncbi:unnamed protein product [Effrenium voratum]|uniref:Uncharacterized protein n=1 Tax=Effrenium voratum TaxID=2562239 RepID=A0AA36IXW2_9DINO|nr:unnamed protein product [Effrenium voratum]